MIWKGKGFKSYNNKRCLWYKVSISLKCFFSFLISHNCSVNYVQNLCKCVTETVVCETNKYAFCIAIVGSIQMNEQTKPSWRKCLHSLRPSEYKYCVIWLIKTFAFVLHHGLASLMVFQHLRVSNKSFYIINYADRTF